MSTDFQKCAYLYSCTRSKYQFLYTKVQFILVLPHFRLVPPHFVCSGDGSGRDTCTCYLQRSGRDWNQTRNGGGLVPCRRKFRKCMLIILLKKLCYVHFEFTYV